MNTIQPMRRGESGHVPVGPMRLRCTLLGIAIFAFGLLIWSRLLLVTNYPKTAIADPPAAAGEQASHAAEAHEDPTLR
ncbi:MAG: hypothetical protein KF869_03790 [Phycisphaeraceae bacterium]|nr:hypothetical protein [Phycisphaeraceae bacterium]